MSAVATDIRDAGPLDIEDLAITFEDEADGLPLAEDRLCSNGTFTLLFTHVACAVND
ncbi:SflA family class IV lanthipeptide [Kitasatospora kifunensis]|uniref:Uncharacterized protein n=1 Tax=Kitasatospora kifunensis TaxID=58351 RepID=A0A7W7VZH6_KITKI|nr:SflA family class IV lanthipeptide [Kitasatospora kifunensis]MBB4927734.1 hypothetical protein [Kitasatospora kifunensis]